MSKGAIKSLSKSDLANIESIRTQAETLLFLLDESGLSEAAALMATAVDAIDAHMRRLPKIGAGEIIRKD